ncbi:MAG: cupin domain-containing protein [Chloroflexi bacterium]|nr:MAG: cupin domain-containing protein [Chloroflexota bacterium]
MSQRKNPGKINPEEHFVMKSASEAQNTCFGCETLIWERVRTLRHERSLSIRSLAEKCGISINTLSLIENNRTSPSVHTLTLLAGGLGVPVAALFEEEKHKQELVYQQDGQRVLIRFPHGTLERLGEGLPPLGAEPILVTLEDDQDNEVSHNGREFIYCLEGKVTCLIAGQTYPLLPGDSLLFDAGTPHRWTNSHPHPSKILVLFCPMEARDQPAEHHLEH